MVKLTRNLGITLVIIILGSAMWLWSANKTPASTIKPLTEPVVVTLGVISDDFDVKRKFDNIANMTLAEVNSYAESRGSHIRFKFLSEHAVDIYAIEAVAKMRGEQGVRIFLGFDVSEAMCASLGYAMSNHVVLLGIPEIHHSHSAIPGDEMFRIAPNLRQIWNVTEDLVEQLAVKGILVIHVRDSWGDGIGNQVAETFGGERVSAVSYDPESVNISELVENISIGLKSLRERFGSDNIAVLLVSKTEGSMILDEAFKAGLLDVPWMYLEESKDPYTIDAELPQITRLSNLDFDNVRIIGLQRASLTNNEVFKKLETDYNAAHLLAGDKLGVMDASFYDSLWVSCLSVLKANTTDANLLKALIPTVASDYFGATGRVVLDKNGDRAVNYEVFNIKKTNGELQWIKIGQYDASTNQMTINLG